MWDLSTGLKEAMLSRRTTNSAKFIGSGVTFAIDGITGTGVGTPFAAGDWVYAVSATNNNSYGKVVSATADAMVFASGTWSVESSTTACLMKIEGGSLLEIMQNGVIQIYDGTQPVNADAAVAGTLLAQLTLNGGTTFASGTSTYGLNLGNLTSSILKKGIDPATTVAEVWSGLGLSASTATWGAWFANTVVTDASTSAIRMYGDVTSTANGDLVMASGMGVAVDVPVVVSEMSIGIFESAYS